MSRAPGPCPSPRPGPPPCLGPCRLRPRLLRGPPPCCPPSSLWHAHCSAPRRACRGFDPSPPGRLCCPASPCPPPAASPSSFRPAARPMPVPGERPLGAHAAAAVPLKPVHPSPRRWRPEGKLLQGSVADVGPAAAVRVGVGGLSFAGVDTALWPDPPFPQKGLN